jgi:hypothetical protein
VACHGELSAYVHLVREAPERLAKPLVCGLAAYIGNCFVQTMIGQFGLLATISCLNVRQVRARTPPVGATPCPVPNRHQKTLKISLHHTRARTIASMPYPHSA